MLTGNGLIVIIGGYLEQEYGDKQKAWSYTMIIVGLYAALTIYNYFSTPRTEDAKRRKKSLEPKVSFGAVFASFFKKNKLGSYWLYYYSVGRIPVTKLTPFLIDDISVGGMGLTTQDVGIIYGTFGLLALTIGGIIGGM
jgi:PAT family beta-lactamase induction signal transducer AmpG